MKYCCIRQRLNIHSINYRLKLHLHKIHKRSHKKRTGSKKNKKHKLTLRNEAEPQCFMTSDISAKFIPLWNRFGIFVFRDSLRFVGCRSPPFFGFD